MEEQMELFTIDETTRELDAEGREILDSLRNLRQEIKGLKSLEEDVRKQFTKYMDDAMVATIDGEPVAKVSTILSERPDLDALRSNPLYAQALAAHVKSMQYTKVEILA